MLNHLMLDYTIEIKLNKSHFIASKSKSGLKSNSCPNILQEMAFDKDVTVFDNVNPKARDCKYL